MPNETPAGSTSESDSHLPTYEDLQAERALKASFAQLLGDHEEIQRLFKSVASQLETTPKIGEDHDLCREWNALFKVRLSGSACACHGTYITRVEAQEAAQRLAAQCKPMCKLSEQYVIAWPGGLCSMTDSDV